MKSVCLLAASALLPLLLAQDLPQRTRLSDYTLHAQVQSFQIGAYYLVHDIPTEKRPYSASDYLVVEIAIFPDSDKPVRISSRDFTLRMNDKKILDPAPPQLVAAALRNSEFDQQTNLLGAGGIGVGGIPDAGIPGAPSVAGPQQSPGRFPGDPNPSRIPDAGSNTIPSVRGPQSRNTDDPNGVGSWRDIPIERAIANAALPEGLLKRPVKGLVFFRFSGKLKSIRALDLVYTDESGSQTALALIKTSAN